MHEDLRERVGALHAEAIAARDYKMAAICLIALGETDSNPAWHFHDYDFRQRLAAMTAEDAVRMCVSALSSAEDDKPEAVGDG
jgi:hypothetical protein